MDNPPVSVTLRVLVDADLDALFAWERDPGAVRLAAFTRADPSDRAAFDTHYRRVRSDPANTLLAVEVGRVLAEHNVGSAAVLTRAGFEQIGTGTAFAAGIGRAVVEFIYRLPPGR